MATHIVCIGGSGLRVLRSMVMMLSAGYDLKSDIKAYKKLHNDTAIRASA